MATARVLLALRLTKFHVRVAELGTPTAQQQLSRLLQQGLLYFSNRHGVNLGDIIFNMWKITLTLIVLILGSLFYWYSYRPSEARKVCAKDAAVYGLGESQTYREDFYQDCLRWRYGMEQ